MAQKLLDMAVERDWFIRKQCRHWSYSNDIDDIVNDIYLKLGEQPDSVFDPNKSSFECWVTVVIRYHCIDRGRKKQSHVPFIKDEFLNVRYTAPPLTYSIDEQRLSEFINTLPVNHQDLVTRLTNGHQYETIAEQSGKPLGTVKAHIHRLRNYCAREFPDKVELIDSLSTFRPV